ncbi:lysylphosphatidylglycerol synthase domain-containing protein [Streptomyces litchfieldiae]|uniref:Lysylphosphatidylglycerol synthase domain-containing protein n=1 Tax=Streptomyces litchfieldiae TaxID=3075543 RepID=A0ABU2MTX7_9ACTN|nr:lysylphosphatidylglycerol synthase domain-containing protein [Streptomyces sp. DSM 44938]MDT0344926.1 lysylphosphatidylglycerol synthase domain-containing protein [Streptomyces sp. DSM 44938]
MNARTPRVRWRAVTGWALVGVILAGLYLTLRGQDWSEARPMVSARALPYLLASCAVNVVALLLAMLSWRSVLADLGHPLGRRTASRIYFVGMSAKYAPGAFWVALTHARLAKPAGVSGLVTFAVWLLNIPLFLLTGLVVGALAGPMVLGAWSWLLLGPVALLLAVLARPAVLGRAAAAGARLLRREIDVSRSGAHPRAALGWMIACRLVSGLYLWLLTLAMGAPPGRALLLSVGAFALATTVSSLVIVLPDGALIRELLLIGALAQVLPLTTAGAVTVASRAVCLVTDLGLIAVHALTLAADRPPAVRATPAASAGEQA